MDVTERIWFLRLWITEGIPYVFKDAPSLYEAIREWLASKIMVDPKEITLIGSGRIGYSLSASQEYGRPFKSESDLDFTVISAPLFLTLKAAFAQWKDDIDEGRVRPQSPGQTRYWPENLKRLPRNLSCGFVDAYKIPNRYQNLDQIMWELTAKLAVTPNGPGPRHKASVRVYQHWAAFFRQTEMNLRDHLRFESVAAGRG